MSWQFYYLEKRTVEKCRVQTKVKVKAGKDLILSVHSREAL